ncbi:KRAB-A domain-containing 2-like [Brachionus plicatilis]|uniref:KRAB-A domain-containing 2-like n=1 Tax=Brachionus plicatilis TaxID=10195 RepID=A0A3M7S8G8_BRAPC|nr:KRAB-A domain-containing 2-like [Brachionus plicatilis]
MPLWTQFTKPSLTFNVRADPNEYEFKNWLMEIGDGFSRVTHSQRKVLFSIRSVYDRKSLKNPDKKKKKTRTITSATEYQALILKIESALEKKTKKTPEGYYFLNQYEILVVGDTKKIIKKRKNQDEPIRFLVPCDQIFETIYRIHYQIGHKARDIMIKKCNENHLNITVDMIKQDHWCCCIPEAYIGDIVVLPIPEVDKGLTEAPNLVCRIVDIDFDKSLYELACEAGVLNTLFARNSFDLVKDCSIELNLKLDKALSVRQAVNELSIGGGQGMEKCNCTGQCMTNRCSCKKSQLLCNSRCHGDNSSCKNK